MHIKKIIMCMALVMFGVFLFAEINHKSLFYLNSVFSLKWKDFKRCSAVMEQIQYYELESRDEFVDEQGLDVARGVFCTDNRGRFKRYSFPLADHEEIFTLEVNDGIYLWAYDSTRPKEVRRSIVSNDVKKKNQASAQYMLDVLDKDSLSYQVIEEQGTQLIFFKAEIENKTSLDIGPVIVVELIFNYSSGYPVRFVYSDQNRTWSSVNVFKNIKMDQSYDEGVFRYDVPSGVKIIENEIY